MQRSIGMIVLVVATLASTRTHADEKSSPEALAMYADAASFQNNGAFDLAVEEWTKFLEKFPKDPLAAKARHYSGVCHVQLKQLDKAIVDFEALIAGFPKFEKLEDAYVNLGWCHYSLGSQNAVEYEKAIAIFDRTAKQFPQGKMLDQAIFYTGESLYAQGKIADAMAAYDRLIKQYPKSNLRGDAMYALGVAQEEGKKWPEAGATYDAFLKDYGSSDKATEVRMRKAETVLQLGDAAGAEKLFALIAAEKEFSAADHALLRQGYCLSKQDKFENAAKVYANLAKTFPESSLVAEANLSAGRSYYWANKFDEAAPLLQKSIEAGGAFAGEAAHWLARTYLRTQQASKVIELVDGILPKVGESAFVVHLKLDQADALFELSDWRAESIERYLKIVAEHPKHELAPQALYNATFGSLELRKLDEALQHGREFETAFANHRLLPDVKFVEAESLLLSSRHADAEKLYREILTAFPQHSETVRWRLQLAMSLLLQKKWNDVTSMLTQALPSLKAPADVAEAQFLMASAQYGNESFADAANSLNASMAADPKWRKADETMILLSRVQQRQNDLPAAIATVKKCITDFPNSSVIDQASYRLGEFLLAAGKFKDAEGAYDSVITKTPKSPLVPSALYGKGWTKIKAGDLAGADAVFSELLTSFSTHTLAADTYLSRALARRQAKNFAGAIADITEFLKSNPPAAKQAEALHERGLAEADMKNYAAATETFTSLLKNVPKYAQADKVLYELAWAHKNQQQGNEAVTVFQRLTTLYPASPLAGEAHYFVGEDQYENKQYAEAIKSYDTAKKVSEAANVVELATYKLGWSHFRLKQYDAAMAQFAEVVEKFPEGKMRPDCLFLKAECLFKQDKFKEALPVFVEATKVKPSTPQLEVLTVLHAGQSAGQLQKWDDCLKLLSDLPTRYPESPYLGEAFYEIAWAKQNLGKSDDAMKDYEQAATRSRDQVGARARFMMGEILFEKKMFDDAIKQFQRVMFGFGGDASGPETKVWQAKAGHEAGRCAEVQIQTTGDAKKRTQLVSDAKRFYEYVASKHPQDNLAAQAKQRLSELKKL